MLTITCGVNGCVKARKFIDKNCLKIQPLCKKLFGTWLRNFVQLHWRRTLVHHFFMAAKSIILRTLLYRCCFLI